MKKVIVILFLLLCLYSLSSVTYAKTVTVTDEPKRPDGACPYHLGDHKVYASGAAGLYNSDGSFNGFYGYYYCRCGYYVLISGHPDSGSPIYSYILPENLISGGCVAFAMSFTLIDYSAIGYTTNTYLPGTIFYPSQGYLPCILGS
jgi:hypothetical protein